MQVVNGYGSVTSSNAVLTVVTLPPTISHAAGESHEQRGHHRDFFGRRLQLVAAELPMAKERNKSRSMAEGFPAQPTAR